MRRAAVAAATLAVAGCGWAAGCYSPMESAYVRSVGATPSGMKVAVFANPNYRSEPASVPPDALEHGLLSTGFFADDDVRPLVPMLGPALFALQPNQRVVVVGADESDPPQYHVFASRGELWVVMYRGDQEVARHAEPLEAQPPAFVPPAPSGNRAVVPSSPPPAASPQPVLVQPVVIQPVVVQQPSPAPTSPARPPAPPIDSPMPSPMAPPPPPRAERARAAQRLAPAEVRARLKELDELHRKGLISDDDYAAKRKELLDQL